MSALPSHLPATLWRALPLLAALSLMLCVELSAVGTAYADPTPVASVARPSTAVPCAAGTTDLGVHYGYYSSIKGLIRLCAVTNLGSSAVESNPTVGPFYIKNSRGIGANRHAIVNSRVSGAVYNMVRDMKAAGLTVSADSTYRSMERQQYLCTHDTRCQHGDHRFLAGPGTSNHQMGLAIDFTTMRQVGVSGTTCAAPATAPTNPVWKWLHTHAAHYGFKQYAAEPWHWEAASTSAC
jgi:hypothetical protein